MGKDANPVRLFQRKFTCSVNLSRKNVL